MGHLLLVDDNRENLYLLTFILESQGHTVRTAADGVEALARAREDPPDIVISDILMPIMDGFTLCRTWKADPELRQIPFVFYTAAYTDSQDERLALDLGADAFIVKPLETEDFLKRVLEVLERARTGDLGPAREPVLVGNDVYKPYSEALVIQLEKKMLQLEEANRVLRETNRALECANRTLEQTIHERERAQAQLRLTQYSIDHAADAVFWTDSEGSLIYVSEATCRTLGYSREELLSMTFFDIDPALSRERWNENWARIRREGALRFETVHKTKEGRVFPVEVNLNHVEWEGVELNCAFARDISQRKMIEEQLRQSQKMEAVGRLAGSIAHDFNNLLTAIIGYCDLALARLQGLDSGLVEDIREARRAADRAVSLTRQVLTFSRRQTLNPVTVSLNQILDGIEPLLRRTLGENIELRIEKEPDLGLTKLDVNLFEQVIINLAVNARDAMPSGGCLTVATGIVELSENDCYALPRLKPGRFAMLAVTDTGHGMDQDTLSHIFEPFFTTKPPGEGTGLGLSTVYGIVEQSGGDIAVRSEVGVGTEFRIYLPIVSP